MKILVIAAIGILLGIGCGSPANNTGVNRLGAVNTSANANAYSRSENAYTFAQNSHFALELTPSGKQAS